MKFSKLVLTVVVLSITTGVAMTSRAQTGTTDPASALTPEAAAAQSAAGLPASKKSSKKGKTQPLDPNSQSSSFVPDPDPLDPLPTNAENLKDEDDIVVDDIKDVLNKPIPPPVLQTPEPEVQPSQPSSARDMHPSKIDEFANDGGTVENSDGSADSSNIIKKARPKPKKSARKKKVYNNNDPDLDLEKRFYQLYKRLNSEPTSTQAWDAVSSPRAAQVYTIQKGDNLYNISGTLFGDSGFWPKIWSLNELDILNPHFIYPNKPIYFYPGTVDMPPTLSLEKTQNTLLPGAVIPSLPIEKSTETPQTPEVATPLAQSAEAPKEGELVEDESGEDAIDKSRKPIISEEKAIDGRTYDRQNTEWKKNIIVRSKKSADDETGFIPDSLPTYYSGKYYEPRKADFTWDIKQAVVRPIEIPPNPYIVTQTVIQTDYKISSADVIQCKDQFFVQKVEKSNPNAQPGRYFVLEQLKLMSSTFKKTQIYRWIATAEIAADNSMRMVRCRQLINTDVILVSQEKINQLQEPTESGAANLEIIEGLDFVNQTFVAANQFVLLSAGSDLIVPDQTYKIYSKQAGVNVGRVHVLKKKGALAIGYVIEASDVISINDSIVVE